jgi:hypothetical protein
LPAAAAAAGLLLGIAMVNFWHGSKKPVFV